MDGRVVAVIAVVVVLIVIAFLVFPRVSKTTKPPKTLNIDLDDTDKEKPCYRVNGVRQGTITLQQGETYQFAVNAPGHPIYFTKSPQGGPGAPENIIGNMDAEKGLAEKGSFNVEVSDAAETGTLYYHSMKAPGMGGKMVIAPKKT